MWLDFIHFKQGWSQDKTKTMHNISSGSAYVLIFLQTDKRVKLNQRMIQSRYTKHWVHHFSLWWLEFGLFSPQWTKPIYVASRNELSFVSAKKNLDQTHIRRNLRWIGSILVHIGLLSWRCESKFLAWVKKCSQFLKSHT